MDLDELQTLIEDCIKRQSKLNEWEKTFIHSIGEQIQTHQLTEKQITQLETIWERVT